MKWTQVTAGEVNGASQRLMVGMGNCAGLTINRINSDPDFAAKVAQFMKDNLHESTPSQSKARAIMGTNFFGIEEAIKYFEADPTRKQLDLLAEIPYSEETLTACKDTHILTAFLPVSIYAIAQHPKLEGIKLLDCQFGVNMNQPSEKTGWFLLRKESYPFVGETHTEHLTALTRDEEVSDGGVLIYTMIGHFIVCGQRLSEGISVLCRDMNGGHLYIKFDAESLSLVSPHFARTYGANLRLSAVQKHPHH